MPTWPVLTTYDSDHLGTIALPLGGIGTGTISLGGRGQLLDFEVVNRPAKGFTPPHAFFCLRCDDGQRVVARALEGVLQPPHDGAIGCRAPNHGLPRFRGCRFEAAYPLGQVHLSDPDVPLEVTLQAFNPFVPANTEVSGLPLAILRYRLTNPTPDTIEAAVCGTLPNFIGTDGSEGQSLGNQNEFRETDGCRGICCRSDLVDLAAPQWGTLALATTTAEATWRTAWADLSWGDSLLDFWDDFLNDGRLEDRAQGQVAQPRGSLAVELTVPPRETREVTFLIGWHFPNRLSWTPGEDGRPAIVGNLYTHQHADAWAVVAEVAPRLDELEARTVEFVAAFCDGDLPPEVKEAALYNLSTLRSTTCFRTADAHFFGWEGCHDNQGCCHGSCTHVWNYEQATPFLFGELARSMREIEFLHATDEQGRMSFRVDLPLDRATSYGKAAADGQMGCLVRLYREWQLSGDDDLLRRLWPAARRALEFCWLPGGWDADGDGVMEGCQHNTMDVEYYGPNPQMQGWYLAALRACEVIAHHLGDQELNEACFEKYRRGRDWMERHLFNGEYYEHEIRPPAEEPVAGLRHNMGAGDLADPDLQLGAGCLVDQLVGQFLAHVCGLGYLLDPDQVRTTLDSVFRYNYQSDLHGHFNHLRTFALNDEAALLMATYPQGRRPRRPFPYFNEVMTGFEYTAAVGMLYEGMIDEGLTCIRSIRARYDGRRRNPFDEAECGHHYARAMASWGAVLALTGFGWSAITGELRFAAAERPATWFWSTGDAWGTLRQESAGGQLKVTVTALGGELSLQRLVVGMQTWTWPGPVELAVGRPLTAQAAVAAS